MMRCRLYLSAPKKVLSVPPGNLLRNASSWKDTGVGIPRDELGAMVEFSFPQARAEPLDASTPRALPVPGGPMSVDTP
jgi:hypothetical protein